MTEVHKQNKQELCRDSKDEMCEVLMMMLAKMLYPLDLTIMIFFLLFLPIHHRVYLIQVVIIGCSVFLLEEWFVWGGHSRNEGWASSFFPKAVMACGQGLWMQTIAWPNLTNMRLSHLTDLAFPQSSVRIINVVLASFSKVFGISTVVVSEL